MTSHSESELAYLSIEQAARLLRRREISPARSGERVARADRAVESVASRVPHRPRRTRRAGRPSSPSEKSAGAARAVRSTAFRFRSRTISGRAEFAPPQARKSWRISCRIRIATLRDCSRSAGAILLGKTNMHEFAYGITGENPHYGSSRNPWARERISGGSSGGSAVAVGSGMGFASVGTDTGGSIRIPSALCGIVGLKPTFGLVSTAGVVPLGTTFDHAGPIARSVDRCLHPAGSDCRKISARRGAAGPSKAAQESPAAFPDRLAEGILFRAPGRRSAALVEAAAKKFESLGARVEEVSLPRLTGAIDQATYAVVAEASAYHESQGYYPARAAEYGDDVRGHLEWGHKLLAVDYLGALPRRREIAEDFEAAFEDVDIILAPTSPIPAPRIGEKRGTRSRRKRNDRARRTAAADAAGECHRVSGHFDSLRIHARGLAGGIAAARPALGRGAAARGRAGL